MSHFLLEDSGDGNKRRKKEVKIDCWCCIPSKLKYNSTPSKVTNVDVQKCSLVKRWCQITAAWPYRCLSHKTQHKRWFVSQEMDQLACKWTQNIDIRKFLVYSLLADYLFKEVGGAGLKNNKPNSRVGYQKFEKFASLQASQWHLKAFLCKCLITFSYTVVRLWVSHPLFWDYIL